MITIKDKNYPALLRQIYNPPQTLYYRGDINILKKTCISIVGTRRNSDYGEYAAKKIVNELAILDIAIVSGLAKGIDTIAHEIALKNSLSTIAVLGSGIDNIYPRENHALASEIEKHGLIISEYPGKKEPLNFQFPQRNRIISGLSIATVIIEAAERSGALITAKLSLEQGREVFAVPGDIDREKSLGTLRLLQCGGAYPITSGKDIIEILGRQPHLFKERRRRDTNTIKKNINSADSDFNFNSDSDSNFQIPISYNLSSNEKQILSLIPKLRSISLDILIQKSELPMSELLAILSILEIKGLIKTNDEKYTRKC